MNKFKPKILFFITKSNWGGAQKYVFDLITDPELLSRYSPVCYAGVTGPNNILFDKIAEFNQHNHTHIACQRLELRNDFNFWHSFINLFDFYKILKSESPDIIHLNSSKISVMMSLVARVYNLMGAFGAHHEAKGQQHTAIVFTGHGWPHDEIHRPYIIRKFLQLMMILTFILSHRTIFVSATTRRALFGNDYINSILKSLLDSKSVIIHNGVDQKVKTILPKLRETVNSPHYGQINLVSIGDYHPNKGHDTVIRYMNSLENTHYHIIGNGEWRTHLEQLIDEHQLHDRVHLVHIPENAAHVLNRYDIYLQPSRKEGFSIAIPEALNAGLPVIARDVGGAKELLPAAALTLYRDDSELIDILRSWRNKSLIQYHEWLDSRFDKSHMIHSTIAMYDSLLH